MKYFIVGNADYAVMIGNYLKNTTKISIDGFTVKGEIIKEHSLNGFPVIPAESMQKLYPPDDCSLLMGIGYRRMNQIRETEYRRYKDMGYTFINYIHPTAIIEKDVVIGEANNIFEGVIIQSGVKMGDANNAYGGAMIAHDTQLGSFNFLSVKACVAGCVHVGNHCFMGANSTVKDHIEISDYTLIGAGAYANKSSNPYDVIAAPKASVLEGRSSLEFI